MDDKAMNANELEQLAAAFDSCASAIRRACHPKYRAADAIHDLAKEALDALDRAEHILGPAATTYQRYEELILRGKEISARRGNSLHLSRNDIDDIMRATCRRWLPCAVPPVGDLVKNHLHELGIIIDAHVVLIAAVAHEDSRKDENANAPSPDCGLDARQKDLPADTLLRSLAQAEQAAMQLVDEIATWTASPTFVDDERRSRAPASHAGAPSDLSLLRIQLQQIPQEMRSLSHDSHQRITSHRLMEIMLSRRKALEPYEREVNFGDYVMKNKVSALALGSIVTFLAAVIHQFFGWIRVYRDTRITDDGDRVAVARDFIANGLDLWSPQNDLQGAVSTTLAIILLAFVAGLMFRFLYWGRLSKIMRKPWSRHSVILDLDEAPPMMLQVKICAIAIIALTLTSALWFMLFLPWSRSPQLLNLSPEGKKRFDASALCATYVMDAGKRQVWTDSTSKARLYLAEDDVASTRRVKPSERCEELVDRLPPSDEISTAPTSLTLNTLLGATSPRDERWGPEFETLRGRLDTLIERVDRLRQPAAPDPSYLKRLDTLIANHQGLVEQIRIFSEGIAASRNQHADAWKAYSNMFERHLKSQEQARRLEICRMYAATRESDKGGTRVARTFTRGSFENECYALIKTAEDPG